MPTGYLDPRTAIIDGEKGDLAEIDEDALNAVSIALRSKGYTAKEIAVAMDVPLEAVRRSLRSGRLNGKLRDVVQDLQASALPLAVEGLIESLEKREKWAISETLRGLGAFQTHTAQQIDTKSISTELSVTFIQPSSPTVINPTGIVGKARALEVIDAVPQREATPMGAHASGETSGIPHCEVGPALEGPAPSAGACLVGGRLTLPALEAAGGVAHADPA